MTAYYFFYYAPLTRGLPVLTLFSALILLLFQSLLSWPEYQGSALQFELTGHPTATTEDLEGPSIMEEDSHTDSLDSTNNVINISASIRNS